MPLSTCNPKNFFDWIKIKWILGGFSVTFGLRNFRRGEGRWSKVFYAHHYVLILNYFRGRSAAPLSIPVEFVLAIYRFSTRLIHVVVVVQFVYSLPYRMLCLVLMPLYSSIDGNRILAVVCCALVINWSFIVEHILIFSSELYPLTMPRWKKYLWKRTKVE